MRVSLTAEAADDLEQARDRYAEIDRELAARFIAGVDAAIERVVMFPDGAPPVEGFAGMRRARLRRFPYGVFYVRPAPDDLLIVRVLRTRQHRDTAVGETAGGPDPRGRDG